MTIQDVRNAVEQLSSSDRGRKMLRGLLKLMDESGVGLDFPNQEAVALLMEAIWGPYTGTVRDMMREATRPTRRSSASKNPNCLKCQSPLIVKRQSNQASVQCWRCPVCRSEFTNADLLAASVG